MLGPQVKKETTKTKLMWAWKNGKDCGISEVSRRGWVGRSQSTKDLEFITYGKRQQGAEGLGQGEGIREWAREG